MKRFRQYVRTIFPNGENAVCLLSLPSMNPIGRSHVTSLLDAYLAMDANGIGARVAAEAVARLADVLAVIMHRLSKERASRSI
jgi:hypothetical protein